MISLVGAIKWLGIDAQSNVANLLHGNDSGRYPCIRGSNWPDDVRGFQAV